MNRHKKENSKDFTKKLLEWINSGYKINIQKLAATNYQKENLRQQSHLQLHQKA